jgi:integrase/recombinase XerD
MSSAPTIKLRWLKFRENKDGSKRWYVCPPPDRKPVRMPDLPFDHPDFRIAHAEACKAAQKSTQRVRGKPGTVEAVAHACKLSPAWGALAPNTRLQRDRQFARMIKEKKPGGTVVGGDIHIVDITPSTIRKNLAKMSPGAASDRLKAWRMLLGHAIDMGLIETDPSREVRKVAPKTDGFAPWTQDDIEAFRKRWPYGTEQRACMELAYWTGARSCDVAVLGRQHVGRDGWLTFKQQKVGTRVSQPFSGSLPDDFEPELRHDHAHLVAALAHTEGRMLFLASRSNAGPRTAKALGIWLARAARAAGVDRTMHGLRKARAIALAELGWTVLRIGAWTGHASLAEIQRYTKDADNRALIEGKRRAG